jgi:hypothetical protein
MRGRTEQLHVEKNGCEDLEVRRHELAEAPIRDRIEHARRFEPAITFVFAPSVERNALRRRLDRIEALDRMRRPVAVRSSTGPSTHT